MCHLCLAKSVCVCVHVRMFTRGRVVLYYPEQCVIQFDVRSQDIEEKINSSQACPQIDTSESWGINKVHSKNTDEGNSLFLFFSH